MKRDGRKFQGALFLFAVILSHFAPGPSGPVAYAEVPHLIRYQGQAVDAKGVPLEGPYTLTFRLYDAESGGTELWKEPQPNVPLLGGHFSVLLGSVTPLTALDWSRPCWLSVQVNQDPELAPRQRITSVPLALRAGVAETAQSAAQADRLTVPITTSTIADDDNSLVPSGAIVLWDGSACPAGYTRVSAVDGKFLVADAAYHPAAGGSNIKDTSHTHGAGSYQASAHVHTLPGHNVTFGGGGPEDDWRIPNDQGRTNGSGPHSVSGTSERDGATSLDIRPAFATILLCKKD